MHTISCFKFCDTDELFLQAWILQHNNIKVSYYVHTCSLLYVAISCCSGSGKLPKNLLANTQPTFVYTCTKSFHEKKLYCQYNM